MINQVFHIKNMFIKFDKQGFWWNYVLIEKPGFLTENPSLERKKKLFCMR